MRLGEQSTWEGRPLIVEWLPSPFAPPRDLVTQASGVCFTDDGEIVLVAGAKHAWSLPGGHPEPGETLEQTLTREVREEACAEICHSVYLGAQQVDDPQSPDGLTHYYQARFWARVRLEPFAPQFERLYRVCVAPSAFLTTLQWGTTRIAQALLEAALTAEAHYTRATGCSPAKSSRR